MSKGNHDDVFTILCLHFTCVCVNCSFGETCCVALWHKWRLLYYTKQVMATLPIQSELKLPGLLAKADGKSCTNQHFQINNR